MSLLSTVGKIFGGPLFDKAIDLFKDHQQGKLTREELKYKITTLAERNAHDIDVQAASIVKAEATSEHFLTSSWRPIIMLAFGGIVVATYFINIFVAPFTDIAPILLPTELWTLLQIGIGGYIASRGGEKIASSIASAIKK